MTKEKEVSVIRKSEEDFYRALAHKESSGNPGIKNQYGYIGLFQMGELSLIDAGYYIKDPTKKNDWIGKWDETKAPSLKDFLENPELQKEAIKSYHKVIWKNYLKGYHEYEGREIAGVTLTKSGMIAAAHLVGAGAFKRFLNSEGKDIPEDGNHVPCTEYLKKFGGYEMSSDFPTIPNIHHNKKHHSVSVAETLQQTLTESSDAFYKTHHQKVKQLLSEPKIDILKFMEETIENQEKCYVPRTRAKIPNKNNSLVR